MSDSVTAGVGSGFVFAAIISWSIWQSFWWMLLHSFFGWLYVIYWAIKYH